MNIKDETILDTQTGKSIAYVKIQYNDGSIIKVPIMTTAEREQIQSMLKQAFMQCSNWIVFDLGRYLAVNLNEVLFIAITERGKPDPWISE